MLAKLKSRKLWAAVVGAAVVALGEQLGLDAAQVEGVVTMLVAFVCAQGFADGARDLALPPRSG
jgi:hypothetical protein